MKKLGFAMLAVVGFFLVAEGLASLVVAGIQIVGTVDDIPFEWRHTEHDPELGWVNRPNVHLPDLYGEGKGFTSNSQRFRATRDYAPRAAEGVTRVLVSGDSFAAGWGVDDTDVWTALLEGPQLETVNLGLGGYGVGQAFLWARRVTRELDYDVHLFTFITDDFVRMQRDQSSLRPKPVVSVRDGRVETVNAPVAEMSAFEQWWRVNGLGRILRPVRFFDLAARIREPFIAREAPAIEQRDGGPADGSFGETFRAIVRELKQDADGRGATLVLAHLPQATDYDGADAEAWRSWLRGVAEQAGVAYWDLLEDFREPPESEFWSFYTGARVRPRGPLVHLTHLSEAGNAFLAERIAARLATIETAP